MKFQGPLFVKRLAAVRAWRGLRPACSNGPLGLRLLMISLDLVLDLGVSANGVGNWQNYCRLRV